MSQITFDQFKEWSQNCRVRDTQKHFEKIVQDAKASGRSWDEEMKAQGYKDYSAFSKACPQFSLTCWPEAFAELGSGFVLYFQFLSFLAVILVLVMLLQLPAIATYSGQDWLQGWNNHEWQSGWSDNSDNCACLGSNNGVQRGGVAEYGTSCKAWDVNWCAANNGTELGKSCCVTWCFASKKCHAPTTGPAYLRNVHEYGMVRATSPCTQAASDANKCSNLLDKPFTGPGVTVASSSYISKHWVTPGNFGPDQADQPLIPLMFLIIVVVMSYSTLVMYQHQLYTDAKVDAGTTSPNDFAVLVKGLPATATDDAAIKRWFVENAVKGKTDTEVVKVVIGWDVEEYHQKIKEIRRLTSCLKQLEPEDPEYKNTQIQIVKIKNDLASTAPDRAARLRSSGIVVVVFRYQTDLRACLDRWTGFWSKWFYSDGEDTCCLPGGNHLWKGAGLPRYPFGNPPVPVNRIKVERAANPGDIHWEELGKDPTEKAKLFAKTNGIMAALVLVSFGITYSLDVLERVMSGDEGACKEGGIGSVLPGVGVAIVNMVLMVSARKLGNQEFHETWTTQEFSQAAKMAGALMINTAGVLLFINLQPREWYQACGLVDDAFMILLMDAILPPFIFFFDIKYQIIGCRSRRKLTQNKIDNWNDTIKQNMGSGKEAVSARNGVIAEVNSFKRVYEPSEMDNPRRYANALNTFFCTLFFSPVFPLAPLIGILGLMVQYCVDKYMLLRWYKRPKRPYNARLSQWSLSSVRYLGPLGTSVAFFVFLSPSWEDKGQVLTPFLFSLIVAAIMILVPSTILRTLLGLRCLLQTKSFEMESDSDADNDYYKAQYKWSKEMKYHKDHFLYKNLSEALNPEFLTPGADSGLKIDDLKGTYGAATADAADADGATSEAMAMKGGRVMAGGGPRASVWGAAPAGSSGEKMTFGAGAPAASTIGAGGSYGVSAAAPADHWPARSTDPAAPEPVPVAPAAAQVVDAPTPHPPAGVVAPTPHPPAAAAPAGAVVWEYEGNHGFVPFNDDCQEFMEKEYSKFQRFGKGKGKGKSHQINVRTSGTTVSVDFDRMTSKVADSHKIRTIRRRED